MQISVHYCGATICLTISRRIPVLSRSMSHVKWPPRFVDPTNDVTGLNKYVTALGLLFDPEYSKVTCVCVDGWAGVGVGVGVPLRCSPLRSSPIMVLQPLTCLDQHSI